MEQTRNNRWKASSSKRPKGSFSTKDSHSPRPPKSHVKPAVTRLVHYYFRTKEQLFIRIFEEKIKIFAGAFFSIDEKPGTFLEKLSTRKIEAHFDIIAQNPKIPFLIINEITTNPQRIKALHKKHRRISGKHHP